MRHCVYGLVLTIAVMTGACEAADDRQEADKNGMLERHSANGDADAEGNLPPTYGCSPEDPECKGGWPPPSGHTKPCAGRGTGDRCEVDSFGARFSGTCKKYAGVMYCDQPDAEGPAETTPAD
jgi:hypothetical protein